MSQKAQEVENPRTELKQMLLLLVNNLLQELFPSSFTTIVDRVVKIHVNTINNDEFLSLAEVMIKNPDMSITLKRSGTGITIVIKLKEIAETSKS